MTILIQILVIFIVINCALKFSFLKSRWGVLYALLCGGFVLLTCRWAILQSKTQWQEFFRDSGMLQNVAVLITLESMLCIAFCFAELRALYNEKQNKWMLVLLRAYPMLLLFPALFYVQVQLIFVFTGSDFYFVSGVLSAAVAIGLPLLSRLFQWLFADRESRFEVHFIISLFVCFIGLIVCGM